MSARMAIGVDPAGPERDWGCWAIRDIDREAETEPPPAFVLVVACGCGARWDEEGFIALPAVGIQDDFNGGEIEMRRCICGSTLERARPSTLAEKRRSEGEDVLAEERAERDAEWRGRGR